MQNIGALRAHHVDSKQNKLLHQHIKRRRKIAGRHPEVLPKLGIPSHLAVTQRPRSVQRGNQVLQYSLLNVVTRVPVDAPGLRQCGPTVHVTEHTTKQGVMLQVSDMVACNMVFEN